MISAHTLLDASSVLAPVRLLQSVALFRWLRSMYVCRKGRNERCFTIPLDVVSQKSAREIDITSTRCVTGGCIHSDALILDLFVVLEWYDFVEMRISNAKFCKWQSLNRLQTWIDYLRESYGLKGQWLQYGCPISVLEKFDGEDYAWINAELNLSACVYLYPQRPASSRKPLILQHPWHSTSRRRGFTRSKNGAFRRRKNSTEVNPSLIPSTDKQISVKNVTRKIGANYRLL